MLVDEEGLKQQKDFQKAWPISRVKKMTLEEYTDLKENNSNYFCYWIESLTYKTGEIGGSPAFKFGIFRMRNIKKHSSSTLKSDTKYAWFSQYGGTRKTAFKNVKKYVLDIANYSIKGDFEQIDDIQFSPMIKWKIAFLYNTKNLIPIFKRDVLEKIAIDQGMHFTKKTKNNKNLFLDIE